MKPFTTIAAVIFAVIALVHILRLFLGWEVTVSGVAIPMWASVAGLVIAAGLAGMLLREARKGMKNDSDPENKQDRCQICEAATIKSH